MIKAFDKKMADSRKEWLSNYESDDILDAKQNNFSFQQFIDKEINSLSNYDNYRSIPSVCDGLKPSLRKILYGVMKKNVQKDIKVAQLSGYVSDILNIIMVKQVFKGYYWISSKFCRFK